MLKFCTSFIALISLASPLYAFTWSAPVAINSDVTSDTTHEAIPKLAVGPDGELVATWISEAYTGTSTVTATRRWDVKTAYSPDAGTTWQNEQTLSNPAFSNGAVDIAAGDMGEFSLAWTSGDIFSEYRFHTATTLDGGDTFTTDTITSPFTPQETGFIAPQLAYAGGNLLLARSSYNLSTPNTQPLYSRYYVKSLDTWVESGMPATADSLISNNELAFDGAGNLVAAHWQSINDVSLGNLYQIIIGTSNNSGTSWTARGAVSPSSIRAIDPDVAAGGNGVWILVYVSDPYGPPSAPKQLAVQRSADNGATWSPPTYFISPVGMADTYRTPSVASNGAGTWMIVLRGEKQVSPAGTYGTDGDLLYLRSTDDGLTWTPMEPVLPDANIDSAIDATPQVEWLGNGKWGLVWSRTDSNNDGDIVWSIGQEPPASVDNWGLYED